MICRIFIFLIFLTLSLTAQTKSTYANDDGRTGWYPNQSMLAPPTVGSSVFGKLFDRQITGQVYAQPLVSGNIVFVATEANWIYGLDVLDGTVRWSRNLGPAWDASNVGCGDLTPQVGVTGTPVIDNISGTAYFLSKTYASGTTGPAAYFMHAVDVTSGAERPNFPVTITGSAQNDPGSQFNATFQLNRVSLLLNNGVVYAGFGGHCDIHPFKGWIAGVSTAGVLTALWTSAPAPNDGAGVWQSGGGLVSDGAGRIFFATGNGWGTTPSITAPSASVPTTGLSESLVRLAVQPDGTVKPDNFFTPYDAPTLDGWDADLGSGSPVALPDAYFGTAAFPHLMMLQGKQGYVYLLNRDDLGGQRMGAGGADAVLNRIGPYGSVWSRPAVWPGDGGHIAVVAAASTSDMPISGQLRVYRYGLDGTGKPTLSQEAISSEQFGSYSSSPVITSDGVNSGTALIWLIQVPDSTGNNAQLMAYDALPINGQMNLRYSTPVGQASKFTPPGVGPARIYVGTRDGHLLGFGVPANVALSAPLTQFGSVITGSASSAQVTITANSTVTIQSLSTTNPAFTPGPVSLPVTLQPGQTLVVPVTFSPSQGALQNGSLHVVTNVGALDFALVGSGVLPAAQLDAFPSVLSLGGTSVGGTLAGSVTWTNDGGQPLTIQGVTPPTAPFTLTGAPPVGTVLAPHQAITLTVQFAPTSTGNYASSLQLASTGGNVTVNITAASNLPGALTVIGQSLNYGRIGVNSVGTLNFLVANTGASPLTISKSKPPALGQFVAATRLDEGTVLQAGEQRQIGVNFSPVSAGNYQDTWLLNSNTTTGLTTVTFSGIAVNATGILNASVNTVPGNISLTTEGPTDWSHWGDQARKAGVFVPPISLAILGNQPLVTFSGDMRNQSWTDGAPIAQATADNSGVFTWGIGNGFALTVPADQNQRTFTVHVGGWNSGAQLKAELSDGSVVPFVDSVPTSPGVYFRDYSFTYKAASANQTLRVTWTYTDGNGNITLTSAALNDPSAPANSGFTVPTGWVYLVSQNSGKCADVEGISTAPGARIHQWTCLNGENQKFQFVPVPGGYKLNIKNSGLQLDVAGGPPAIQDGQPYIQYPFWGGTNEIFNLAPQSDGTFELVASHSGKCMDVEGISKDDGAYIHQWTCLSAPNQKWSLIPAQ